MVIWLSDNSDSDKVEGDWDDDDEAELSPSPAPRNPDAPGPSTLVVPQERADWAVSSGYSVEDYVAMGFTKEMVLKGIKIIGKTSANGDGEPNPLLELLLTYKELDDENGWDDENVAFERDSSSNGSDIEDFLQEMTQRDEKIKSLVEMGFPKDEANIAITRCGLDSALSILIDSIYASETADAHEIREDNVIESSLARKKARLMENSLKRKKQYGGGAQKHPIMWDCSHEDSLRIPNPNLPSDSRSVSRRIPVEASGPPFFYFENIARAPNGVWDTISSFLYGIRPEFEDSKFFSAATRKRGYLHNLPLDNRFDLRPIPPKSILEAFPHYGKWWPSWDGRRQFNCLRTRVASAQLLGRIRCDLEDQGNPPSKSVQNFVLGECKNWNLVWIGENRVAPLEPDEMELLLGYPRDHTRGVPRTERYRSLGNAFQVDTVANHLSVLKSMFPDGINVLSLFSGIGGAEVALHRLGINMRAVVAVEISAVNRRILKSWWDQTQSGRLIEIERVQSLTHDKIKSYITELGGFHLVIGCSPCNNLTGSNRYHRDGLEGEHSVLFHEYARIVRSVLSIMKAV